MEGVPLGMNAGNPGDPKLRPGGENRPQVKAPSGFVGAWIQVDSDVDGISVERSVTCSVVSGDAVLGGNVVCV